MSHVRWLHCCSAGSRKNGGSPETENGNDFRAGKLAEAGERKNGASPEKNRHDTQA